MRIDKLKMRSKHDSEYFYITVNNDPERIIKLSLGDTDLLSNATKLTNAVRKMVGEWISYCAITDNDDLESPQAVDVLIKIRKEFNKVFGTDSFDKLFTGKHPFYQVGKSYFFVYVMEKLIPHLRKFDNLKHTDSMQ